MTTRISAYIGGMLLLFSSGLSAQTLVYEREYTLIAEEENTLRIELYPDDRLIVDRPVSMTHSGLHDLQAPRGTYDRMLQKFQAAHTDSDALYEDVQRLSKAGDVEWVVTDPEFSRFALVGPDRSVLQRVTAVSLEAWAARLDEPRLDKLSSMENAWFELMNSQIGGGVQ